MQGKGDKSTGGGDPSLAIGSGVIGGSTGGASESDLRRGYTRPDQPDTPPLADGLGGMYPDESFRENNGFLDRPTGFER